MDFTVKNRKLLYLLISGTVFAYIILQSTYYYSSDYYFLVATGKEIIENGIPYTNPWFIDKEIPFIAQQWLYAVYLYYIDKLGAIGVTLSIVAIETILAALLYKYINSKLDNKALAVLCSLGCIVYHINYIVNVRPEAITLVLLMIQILATENYIKNKKIYNIVIIVVTAILEANVHGSMSVMHIAIMLAYSVPSIYKKLIPNKDFGSIKEKVIVLVLLILASFAQPYGIKGAFYSIEGLFGGALDVYSTTEMTSVPIGSNYAVPIILQSLVFLYLLTHKKLESCAAYTCLGLLYLEISAYKHTMFSCMINAILIVPLLNELSDKIKVKINIELNKILLVLPNILCIVMGISYVNNTIQKVLANNITVDVDYYLDGVEEPSEKLEELGVAKDTPIYTTLDYTSYLEYLGYNNLYMDARPEMYYVQSKVTDTTVLQEFVYYTIYGCSYNNNGDVHVLSSDDYEAFLNGYGFKYCLVNADIDTVLAIHLVNNQDKWELISSGSEYELWAKKE